MLSPYVFAVLDTETTWFHSSKWDKLLEIAVVKIRDWKVIKKDFFSTLIDPQREIPISATRVNKITNEMVAWKPKVEDVIDEFIDFFSDVNYTLIHNAKFDLWFINYELNKLWKNFKLPSPVCTVELSKKLYPHYNAHNLDAISRRCKLSIEDWELRHRALWDVILTWEVFLRFFEENPMLLLHEVEEISLKYR